MNASAPTKSAHVLIVDDERGLSQMLRGQLESLGHVAEVCESAEAAISRLETWLPDLLLVDVHMPGMSGLELVTSLKRRDRLPPTVVMSAYGAVDLARQAVQAGAADFLSKPFRLAELQLKVELTLERSRMTRPLADTRRQQSTHAAGGPSRQDRPFHGMVGTGASSQALFQTIELVARYPSTVLIQGESGTGKELVAKALHHASPRRDRPFVAVNCGAIPESLLESELFGHVQGAFTDATNDRQGLFVQADGGTLFLDEVVDLPLSLQVALLRAIQDGEIRPVGSVSTQRVDVRVVAASAKSLRERVESGAFREDLFYRLSVIELVVPPLRERVEDIEPLVTHLVERTNRRIGTSVRQVTPAAMVKLRAYTWPGNVRELLNVLEQSCVLTDGDEVDVLDLPEHIQQHRPMEPAQPRQALDLGDSLSVPRAVAALERRYIEAALRRTGGNRTEAARLLEISQRSLLNKIKTYDIDIPGRVGRPSRS